MGENESDENKYYGDEEESDGGIDETLHGKQAYNLLQLYFNFER